MNIENSLKNTWIVVVASVLLMSCKQDVKEAVAEPGSDNTTEAIKETDTKTEVTDATKDAEEMEKAAKASKEKPSVEAAKTAEKHVFGSVAMPEIKIQGSIKQIMTGNFSKTGALSSLQGKEHVYAVGELAGLSGSVQVFDGISYVVRTQDQQILTEETFEGNTSLLVSTEVERWKKIKIPVQVKSVGQFRIFILQQARAIGIDVTQPFPFMIEGNMRKLNFHILDWNPDHPKDNNSFFFQSGYQAAMYNQEIELFGFYSEPTKGDYLLDKQNFHAHFVTENKEFAGHVDNMFLGEGMSLKLPLK